MGDDEGAGARGKVRKKWGGGRGPSVMAPEPDVLIVSERWIRAYEEN